MTLRCYLLCKLVFAKLKKPYLVFRRFFGLNVPILAEMEEYQCELLRQQFAAATEAVVFSKSKH